MWWWRLAVTKSSWTICNDLGRQRLGASGLDLDLYGGLTKPYICQFINWDISAWQNCLNRSCFHVCGKYETRFVATNMKYESSFWWLAEPYMYMHSTVCQRGEFLPSGCRVMRNFWQNTQPRGDASVAIMEEVDPISNPAVCDLDLNLRRRLLWTLCLLF